MVEFIRLISHQVGVVIGRLDQYGLTGGPQGFELILEPNAVTIALDDVGEPLRVAKGARGARATIIVGLAARLLNVKYERHGLYLQRHDLGAMELGDAKRRRNRNAICRGNAAAGKDSQTVSRVLD